jgi:PAS domain S-box-containing protein
MSALSARFLRSKSGSGFLKYLGFSAVLAVAVAYGVYDLGLRWFQQTKSEEQLTALQLVDAFVADYSDNRGKFMSGEAPVPATFRAHAIERFNHARDAAGALRLVMVGPAGREIAIAPSDADMTRSIERFGREAKPTPETRFVELNGETFFRAIYPSLASQQSCVECHNKLQGGKWQWKLGDVLGAFVIDVPAAQFLYTARMESIGVGLALFLLLGGVGFYVSRLHFRQLAEREAAQALVQQSEERFRVYAETASDWFWEQDENLRFSYLSNAVKDKSGLAPSAHIGKTRREVIHLGVTEDQWRDHQADLDARRPFRDFRFQRAMPDGAIRHISINGRPYFDANGQFRGYRGTARDITKDVSIEIELERRVQERTAELRVVQDELLRKERLATLGQLTATVSHELRNPLGVIRNTIFTVAEMANSGGLKLDRPIARIERSIARCDGIITELLDYTRIKELHRRPLPIDAWLGEVLDEQKIADGITLIREFGALNREISLDPERLRRVIINLIDNAGQAIEGARGIAAGAPSSQIIVRTRAIADRIEIEIADTGPGIAPDILPRIFEPLFSTKGFGVGLGLPTVKQIVEHHGGGIEVTSEVGSGTSVLVWLPLSQAEVIAA